MILRANIASKFKHFTANTLLFRNAGGKLIAKSGRCQDSAKRKGAHCLVGER